MEHGLEGGWRRGSAGRAGRDQYRAGWWLPMRMGLTMKSLLVFSCLAIMAPAALAQLPKIEAIVNAASFEPGLPLGGALATVFVSGLNSPQFHGFPGTYIANSFPLPYQLGGMSVSVCQFLAPMLAVVIPPT